MKFHLYSLKVSTNVKISMQCFENFGERKCPKCPPPPVARLIGFDNFVLNFFATFGSVLKLQIALLNILVLWSFSILSRLYNVFV